MTTKRKISLIALPVMAAIVVIMGIRWLIGARTQSAYASCIAQLRQIEGAKGAWALEEGKGTNDVPTLSDLFGPGRYMAKTPVCPQGGTYTVGSVGDLSRCSLPMHSLYFGMVAVVDDANAPVADATVTVEGVTLKGETTLTDADGRTIITRFSGVVVDDWSRGLGSVVAAKAGYQSGHVKLPAGWPMVITLKAERANR